MKTIAVDRTGAAPRLLTLAAMGASRWGCALVTILLIAGFAAQCRALQCADELEVLQDNLSDKTLALAECLREANVLNLRLKQQQLQQVRG